MKKLLSKITPKFYNNLNRSQKTNVLIISGNMMIWTDDLCNLFSRVLNLNIEFPSTLNLLLSITGLIFIIYPWIYLVRSIYNFKFYRKYIKRNKIWVKELNSENMIKYTILSDLYIKQSNNESNGIIINILELLNNHNIFMKNDIINIINSSISFGVDINEFTENPDSIISTIIENRSNKIITYTISEDIYLINNREQSINDILSN